MECIAPNIEHSYDIKRNVKCIKIAITGDLGILVVTYKDRLCRFSFDLIEYLIKTYSDGKIEIENKKYLSPNEELMDDMLEVMNVFVAKRNGLRKYNISDDSKKNLK